MLTLRCTHGIQDNKYTKYTSSVIYIGEHHGRIHVEVGYTTTCAISAYHHLSWEFEHR
jgi:hypothetical protein